MPAQLPAQAPSHTSPVEWLAAHSPSSSACGPAVLRHHLCSVVAADLHCTQLCITAAGHAEHHEVRQPALQSCRHILQGEWIRSTHMQRSKAASPYSSQRGTPVHYLPVRSDPQICHGQACSSRPVTNVHDAWHVARTCWDDSSMLSGLYMKRELSLHWHSGQLALKTTKAPHRFH